MFLNDLSQVEKKAFLSLAVQAAQSNDDLAAEQEAMIKEYCRETGFATFDIEKAESMDALIELFKNSAVQNRKIILLETVGLMYADGTYDETEKAFVSKLADEIGLSAETKKKLETLIERYLDLTKDILECITQETV